MYFKKCNQLVVYFLVIANFDLSSNLISDIFEIPPHVELVLIGNFSSKEILPYLLTSHVIVGFNATSKFNSLTGPIVIFNCENDDQFRTATSYVVQFIQSNKVGKFWKPIFVLVHPGKNISWTRGLSADPIIQPLIEHGAVDSPVYILYRQEPKSQGLLVEVYSIRNQRIIQRTHLTDSLRSNFEELAFMTSRRSNFHKGTVIAVAMDDPDYPLATEFKSNSTQLIGGFEVEIYQYFRDALNFTESAIRGTDYLREGPNGTIIGHALQVNDDDGDIGIGAAEFLEYRVKGPNGINFLHPTFHARVVAFFKQLPPSSIRNIFTQTFTTELWLTCSSMWALILFVLKTTLRLKKYQNESHQKDEMIGEEYAVWAFGAICQQGWYMRPYATSIKIIFYFGIFLGLISFIAYSAALVSILSVEVVPIRVFDDLIKENFYIASDNHIPTAKAVVKDLEDAGKIRKLGYGGRDLEMADNFEHLFKTRLAIVTIPDSFYPIIQQNYTEDFVCSTVSVKVVSPRPLKSSCIVRKGSSLREFLNYKLLQMQERGVKDRLIKHYILGTSIQCLRSSGSVQIQLGLKDIFTAFLIISFGFLLGLILALMEKLCFLRATRQHSL